MPTTTAVPGDYGWTSGISFNSTRWFDSYSGFHNIISNNFVAGEYDGSSHHTDGNGIILDLSNGSYDYASADTPPALVVNNVVYGNRSEEHTSELQSHSDLVCRLLLEKKKKKNKTLTKEKAGLAKQHGELAAFGWRLVAA